MIPLSLGQVGDAVDAELVIHPEITVAAVSTDSRVLEPGSLFVALPGEERDGHDWVPDAVAAGAAAVLVARDIEVAAHVGVIRVRDTWSGLLALGGHVRTIVDPTTVAVTGSVGKTTTKDLVAAALAGARRTAAATGSFNNELGVPLTLLELQRDTEALVVEVGARRPGDIAHLGASIAPDIAIVTAVAPVHLELFGSIDVITNTKAELVGVLSTGGTAVLNGDDARVVGMAEGRDVDVVTYGESPAATVHLLDITVDDRAHPTAKVVTPWGDLEVTVPVAGRHNAWNAAAAIAVAGVMGIDLATAAAGISQAAVSRWRGEVIDIGGVRFLNDAYNANPVAMRAALDTLDALATGRRVAVLGVMAEIGPSHDQEHHSVGTSVPEHADVLVVVGPEAAAIGIGAEDAGMAVDAVHMVATTDAALAILGDVLVPGDTVLVKASRVAGLEQIVDGWRERTGGTST